MEVEGSQGNGIQRMLYLTFELFYINKLCE